MIPNPRHRRSPKNLTIDDVYPDWVTDGGIFGDLTSMPWSESVVAVDIGIMYGANSAERFIAPMVYKFLDEDGEFATGARASLANAIKARFLQKWTHLWELYNLEYSPLDTYNLTETGGKGSNTSVNGSFTHGHVVTDSGTERDSYQHGHIITDSGTDSVETEYGKITTDTGEPSVTTEHQRQGFNSSDYQDVTKDTENTVTDNVETLSGSDESTTTYGKIETHSGTDVDSTTFGKVVTNSGQDSDSKTTVYGEEYSSTKSGLMYRAPAELMDIDRTFWLEDYFSIVFEDIDSVITLAIYPERTINYKVF